MIDSSLLFQVSPFVPVFFSSMVPFMVIVGLSFFFVWIFFLFQRKNNPIIESYKKSAYVLPVISDTDFESQCALYVRSILGIGVRYPEAMTAEEYRKTLKRNQKNILDILISLESAEYTSQKLSQSEREKILQSLQTKE